MADTLFVRRDIWSLAADDPIITGYAAAIEMMRDRPSSDPTSWTHQAAIHGFGSRPAPPLANECRHQGWYFLPWHRMYLYYFERIVRAAVVETGGPEDWALPYWNYGRNGRNATMPLPFRPPPVGLAALAMPRNPGINTGATIPSTITSATRALARRVYTGTPQFGGGATGPGQFEGETGRLEQTPHNDIHVTIGGFMGNPDTAALDPIFWLHHCNIDRLWAVWNGQRRLNPTDGDWTDQPFSFFDADGTEASKTCGEVNDTVDDLSYTYRPRPAPARRVTPAPTAPQEAILTGSSLDEPEPELVGASERPVELVGATARVSVPIDPQARAGLLGDTDADASATPRRVYLNVEDIEAEQNPGTVYGIYVNLPEDAPPDVAALHYAGNVSFFGIERARDPRGDEHGHGMRVAMEITDLVRDLRETGDWDDETLDVVFKPIELIPPEVPDHDDAVLMASERENPPVSIGRVSVFYG